VKEILNEVFGVIEVLEDPMILIESINSKMKAKYKGFSLRFYSRETNVSILKEELLGQLECYLEVYTLNGVCKLDSERSVNL
jgi:hypothetical protein